MSPEFQAILGATLSSVLGLIGGFLLLARYEGVKRWSGFFVSFAAGALLGAAFFDLLPEAIEETTGELTTIFWWLMAGFILFFLIEKFLHWHHHSHGPTEIHEVEHHHAALGPLVIAGDAVHNFIDGAVIAAAFLVHPALGVTTALAVLAHELPQEIGDFAILVHTGMKRSRIVTWNLLGALISPLGAVLTILLAGSIDGIEVPLLALAAGMFIYIASADLVPEIHRTKQAKATLLQLVLLAVGLFVIIGIGNIFPHEHPNQSQSGLIEQTQSD